MTIRVTRIAVSAAVALMTSGLVVLAHHGDAGRYEEFLTTVTGTVVEVQLVNPHSILILDVEGEDGKVTRWRGELGSPSGLRRAGWGTTTVRAGDRVTMRGRQLLSGSPYMTLSECARVIDADGKEVFRGNDPGQGGGGRGADAPTGEDPCAGPIK